MKEDLFDIIFGTAITIIICFSITQIIGCVEKENKQSHDYKMELLKTAGCVEKLK